MEVEALNERRSKPKMKRWREEAEEDEWKPVASTSGGDEISDAQVDSESDFIDDRSLDDSDSGADTCAYSDGESTVKAKKLARKLKQNRKRRIKIRPASDSESDDEPTPSIKIKSRPKKRQRIESDSDDQDKETTQNKSKDTKPIPVLKIKRSPVVVLSRLDIDHQQHKKQPTTVQTSHNISAAKGPADAKAEDKENKDRTLSGKSKKRKHIQKDCQKTKKRKIQMEPTNDVGHKEGPFITTPDDFTLNADTTEDQYQAYVAKLIRLSKLGVPASAAGDATSASKAVDSTEDANLNAIAGDGDASAIVSEQESKGIFTTSQSRSSGSKVSHEMSCGTGVQKSEGGESSQPCNMPCREDETQPRSSVASNLQPTSPMKNVCTLSGVRQVEESRQDRLVGPVTQPKSDVLPSYPKCPSTTGIDAVSKVIQVGKYEQSCVAKPDSSRLEDTKVMYKTTQDGPSTILGPDSISEVFSVAEPESQVKLNMITSCRSGSQVEETNILPALPTKPSPSLAPVAKCPLHGTVVNGSAPVTDVIIVTDTVNQKEEPGLACAAPLLAPGACSPAVKVDPTMDSSLDSSNPVGKCPLHGTVVHKAGSALKGETPVISLEDKTTPIVIKSIEGNVGSSITEIPTIVLDSDEEKEIDRQVEKKPTLDAITDEALWTALRMPTCRCGLTFKDDSLLKIHKAIHAPKGRRCASCRETFDTWFNFHSHLVVKHVSLKQGSLAVFQSYIYIDDDDVIEMDAPLKDCKVKNSPITIVTKSPHKATAKKKVNDKSCRHEEHPPSKTDEKERSMDAQQKHGSQ